MWVIRKVRQSINNDIFHQETSKKYQDDGILPETRMQTRQNHNPNHTATATTTSKGITIAIAGGGIVGLTLALSLHKHFISHLATATNGDRENTGLKNNGDDGNVTVIIYEQAPSFADDVGAGMCLYTNGLRVLRDIDLLDKVIADGYRFQYRHWTRHDGTIIASASENVLSSTSTTDEKEAHDSKKLESLGIRRWKLQKILYDAVKERNIPIVFGKKIVKIRRNDDLFHTTRNQRESAQIKCNTSNYEEQFRSCCPLKLFMQDGAMEYADILLVADGIKSCIREQLLDQKRKMSQDEPSPPIYPTLSHCGMTCLMGISEVKHTTNGNLTMGSTRDGESPPDDMVSMGISFPSSNTTGCHAVFFPTSTKEKCFQFYFPASTIENHKNNHQLLSSWNPSTISSWGNMNSSVVQQESKELIEKLKNDGWHYDYIEPLENATSVLRIGLSLLEPTGLNQFVFSLQDVPYSDDDQNGDDIAVEPEVSPSMNRIVLIGDAAHPTVPYLNQGAQMGLEDAGVLALLIKHYCINDVSRFSLQKWDDAMLLFEQLRLPRTQSILHDSLQFGLKQEMRCGQYSIRNDHYSTSGSNTTNPDIDTRTSRRLQCEEQYKREVFFYETLSSLLPGVQYNYQTVVEEALHLANKKSI